MKRYSYVSMGVILILLAFSWSANAQSSATHIIAILIGAKEVPSVETRALGFAHFQLNSENNAILDYKLMLTNIKEVTQAHLHLAPRRENGPIVAFLLDFRALPISIVTGILKGSIDASDLVGPLAGMTLDDLIREMEMGNIYVNVHTTAHPIGEIRGQVRVLQPNDN